MKLIDLAAVAALLTGFTASAQDVDLTEPTVSRGQGWSVLAGNTVGAGDTVIAGAVGWPGISATLLHGVTSKVDIGGRFTFNYGYQGIVTDPVVPGLKLNGVLRVMLLETSRFNFGFHFAPGPYFYFYNRFTRIGLDLPFGFAMGIPVGAAVMLNVGLDFPMYVLFGPGGGLSFPILIGAGIEYFIDRNLSANFNMRMGPTVNGYTRFAPFTLQATVGIAWKL